jgi:hypothetical protein
VCEDNESLVPNEEGDFKSDLEFGAHSYNFKLKAAISPF